MEVEVHVLDPEAQPFHEAHPCPVEQAEEEPVLSGQAREDIPHLRLGQHDGQAAPALGPDQTFELAKIAAENCLIKKEKGAQRLALSGGAHPPLDSQVREKGVDFPLPHFYRVPLAMEKDVSPDPMQVCLLGAEAHVPHTQGISNLFEKPRCSWGSHVRHLSLLAAWSAAAR